jgi:hypothetical protein
MEDLEFIEAHAVVGYGQQWQQHTVNRDDVIALHIQQTTEELGDND